MEIVLIMFAGGCYLNTFLFSVDRQITVTYDNIEYKDIYSNGYTGIEIEAKNGGYFTYIKIYGFISGFRNALNIHTNGDKGSWITDGEFYVDTKGSYGGILNLYPIRVHGSHQPTIDLTPDDSKYYFKSNAGGFSDAMIWDLGQKHSSNKVLTNASIPFLSNSGVLDVINSKKSDYELEILPKQKYIRDYINQDFSSYISSAANLLESTFLNLQGARITNNELYGNNSIIDNNKVINSIRLLNSSNEQDFIELNESNIYNYSKVFKLSNFSNSIIGGGNFLHSDQSIISEDIDLKYDKYHLEFTFSNMYYSLSNIKYLYICPIINDLNVKIYLDEHLVLDKVFKYEDVYYTNYLIYYPLENYPIEEYSNIKFIITTVINNKYKKGRILPKIGIISSNKSNVITSSGGEIVGRAVFNDIALYNKKDHNNFRYIINKFISTQFYDLNKNIYTPVLSLYSLYNYSMSVVYMTEYGISSFSFRSGAITCNDENLKISIDIDETKDNHRLLIKVSNCSSFRILECFGSSSIQFEDINKKGNYTKTVIYNPKLKKGTTSQRPTGVQIGYTYKDTDLGKWIIWGGDTWENIDGNPLE